MSTTYLFLRFLLLIPSCRLSAIPFRHMCANGMEFHSLRCHYIDGRKLRMLQKAMIFHISALFYLLHKTMNTHRSKQRKSEKNTKWNCILYGNAVVFWSHFPYLLFIMPERVNTLHVCISFGFIEFCIHVSVSPFPSFPEWQFIYNGGVHSFCSAAHWMRSLSFCSNAIVVANDCC